MSGMHLYMDFGLAGGRDIVSVGKGLIRFIAINPGGNTVGAPGVERIMLIIMVN
jgi:hypothetical protein